MSEQLQDITAKLDMQKLCQGDMIQNSHSEYSWPLHEVDPTSHNGEYLLQMRNTELARPGDVVLLLRKFFYATRTRESDMWYVLTCHGDVGIMHVNPNWWKLVES